MFGIDFYPTPDNVIAEILQFSNISGKVCLEPSAGSGNIVQYLKENGAKEILACEIDSRLRSMIEKKCRILKNDFFEVEKSEVSHIDMIVMNPPFSSQEKHILHAWDVAPSGCEIISLCNASMIQNRYSENREKIAELIKFHGRSEYLGDIFKTADRKTGVECSVIYLYKPAEDSDFDFYFDLSEDKEQQGNGIMTYDFIRDVVNRYIGALREYDNVLDCAVRMNDLVKGYMKNDSTFTCSINETTILRETFRKELQKQMWKVIFEKLNMSKYITTGVMADINKFVEQQTNVPFTMKNIYKMLEIIVGTQAARMDKVLIEAFENICSFSYENSTAGEKWRTNSDYMINRKFIVPYLTKDESYSDYVRVTYYATRNADKIDDIVKALCTITGKNFDDLKFTDSRGVSSPLRFYYFVNDSLLNWGQWYDFSPFFRIKCFKKGTVHFEFKDDEVWAKFNQRVAQIKGRRLPNKKNKNNNNQRN